uniref:Potassium channel domain-containing protein n=1 Tax=Parascaris equorum TaxID=6256 RepID=A0A914S535_PAREQ
MPVLLRSQLDHIRGSRTNLTSRPSGLLHPPSHEAPSFPRLSGCNKTRRDSNQSVANDLLPLVFMMLYMVIGAVLFLWIEGPADLHRRSIDFAYYERERELFLKRMEEIYRDRAAAEPLQRRLFLEEAIDYFHQQISVTFTNQTDWSLTTALYYSGTVFTTIGQNLGCRVIVS